MRKQLLIGLAVYLAVGVLFGFVTDGQDYTCPQAYEFTTVPDDATLADADFVCDPILSASDRLQWVATTTPAWLPLVVRNVVRGDGIATYATRPR